MTALPSAKAGFLRHDLDGQVLVYDSKDNRVHLLDPTTGCVLELLEQGGWTREGIIWELSSRFGFDKDPAFLELALEALRDAELLVPSPVAPEPIDVGRREVLRKVALAGAAAFMIPAVITLTPQTGLAQSAAGNLGQCAACTSNAQCASNNCGSDTVRRACGSARTANGGTCNGGGNCCSTVCSGGICV